MAPRPVFASRETACRVVHATEMGISRPVNWESPDSRALGSDDGLQEISASQFKAAVSLRKQRASESSGNDRETWPPKASPLPEVLAPLVLSMMGHAGHTPQILELLLKLGRSHMWHAASCMVGVTPLLHFSSMDMFRRLRSLLSEVGKEVYKQEMSRRGLVHALVMRVAEPIQALMIDLPEANHSLDPPQPESEAMKLFHQNLAISSHGIRPIELFIFSTPWKGMQLHLALYLEVSRIPRHELEQPDPDSFGASYRNASGMKLRCVAGSLMGRDLESDIYSLVKPNNVDFFAYHANTTINASLWMHSVLSDHEPFMPAYARCFKVSWPVLSSRQMAGYNELDHRANWLRDTLSMLRGRSPFKSLVVLRGGFCWTEPWDSSKVKPQPRLRGWKRVHAEDDDPNDIVADQPTTEMIGAPVDHSSGFLHDYTYSFLQRMVRSKHLVKIETVDCLEMAVNRYSVPLADVEQSRGTLPAEKAEIYLTFVNVGEQSECDGCGYRYAQKGDELESRIAKSGTRPRPRVTKGKFCIYRFLE